MAIDPAFRKYIVVVMGSSQSGVTEFVNRISELDPQTTPDPNPSKTLKPMDYGRLTLDAGNVLYIYGISEANPTSAWTFLFDRDDPIGVISVIDSTRPIGFPIDKMLIDYIDGDVPYLVAANKYDCKDVVELDSIRLSLGLSSDTQVIACSARTGLGISDIVVKIVDMLFTFEPTEELSDDTAPMEAVDL